MTGSGETSVTEGTTEKDETTGAMIAIDGTIGTVVTAETETETATTATVAAALVPTAGTAMNTARRSSV